MFLKSKKKLILKNNLATKNVNKCKIKLYL